MYESKLGPEQELDERMLQRLAAAMADPMRTRILAAVFERPGITVKEIADWTGETNRKVRYHVEALEGHGLLEVQGEARRRGAIERQYRATITPFLDAEEVASVSRSQERRISIEVLKMIMADATGSLAAGQFETRDGHCALRLHGTVDADGWAELSKLMLRTCREAQDIVSSSGRRLEEDPEQEELETTAAMLLFEAPIWKRD